MNNVKTFEILSNLTAATYYNREKMVELGYVHSFELPKAGRGRKPLGYALTAKGRNFLNRELATLRAQMAGIQSDIRNAESMIAEMDRHAARIAEAARIEAARVEAARIEAARIEEETKKNMKQGEARRLMNELKKNLRSGNVKMSEVIEELGPKAVFSEMEKRFW